MNELRNEIDRLENKEFSDDFTIIEGYMPVVLSAPHTMNHMRDDGTIKASEPYTKALALYLQKRLNCTCFVKNFDTGIDSNSEKDEEYKNELIKYIKRNNIKLVLDLHGASLKREFDVELGTLNNLSADYSTIKELKEAFIENGILKVNVNDPFKGGGITKKVYSETLVDVIQIEINRKYRDLNISNFMLLADALEKFIRSFMEK